MGRKEIFRVHEFFTHLEDETNIETDQISAAREMLEQYSEEE